MKSEITQLQAALSTYRSKHQSSMSDPSIANTALSIATQGLEQLNKDNGKLSRKSAAEDQSDSNSTYPFFDSTYQYFAKVCWVLQVKSTYGREIYAEYIDKELNAVTEFLKYHLQFTQHIFVNPLQRSPAHAGSDTAPITSSKLTAITSSEQLEMLFNSPYLKANTDYKRFLESERKLYEKPSLPTDGKIYEFAGSQADAMENIEGWTEMKVIKVNGEYANFR
ncbi:unnamed protein product, partial [marine sediment metagenome]